MAEGDRTYYEDGNGVRRLKQAGDGPAAPDRTGYVELGPQATTEPTSNDRTVAELREALDAAGVAYSSSAKKDELVTLAGEHNV